MSIGPIILVLGILALLAGGALLGAAILKGSRV